MDRDVPAIDGTDLTEVFDTDPGSAERVGVEIEMAALDPRTGRAVAYQGPNGVRNILDSVLAEGDAEPILDEDVLIGVVRADGTKISLEPGGAVEYSPPPHPDVTSLMATVRTQLRWLAACAARFGIALVPGGNYPFGDVAGINWTPNRRIAIMIDYFSSMGAAGACGREVMGLTLSTQTTLDYVSRDDLSRKLRMQVAVSPVASALFVNSPLVAGRPSGVQSRRMEYWFSHSPGRTGILPPGLRERPSTEEFVAWALGLAMIYRKRGKGYVAAPDVPFRELLRDGFPDGTKPTWSDWTQHLSQIWTDVRLRRTLELRACDGPPQASIGAAPAFWAGLSYDPASCHAAWELTGRRPAAQYRATMHDIARRGLRASFDSVPVADVAAELVRLAKQGLRARVAAGRESPDALRYLEPLEEVLDSGETFADTCLRRWERELHRRPDRYISAYRV